MTNFGRPLSAQSSAAEQKYDNQRDRSGEQVGQKANAQLKVWVFSPLNGKTIQIGKTKKKNTLKEYPYDPLESLPQNPLQFPKRLKLY